jgi:hypothetical protein
LISRTERFQRSSLAFSKLHAIRSIVGGKSKSHDIGELVGFDPAPRLNVLCPPAKVPSLIHNSVPVVESAAAKKSTINVE